MVRKFEPIEEFQSWSGIIRRRSDINVQCVKNEETRQFWMFYGKRIKIWKKRRKTSHVIFIRARLFILKVNISSLLKNVLHSGRSNETIYNFQTLWNAELHCASLQWLKTSQRVSSTSFASQLEQSWFASYNLVWRDLTFSVPHGWPDGWLFKAACPS